MITLLIGIAGMTMLLVAFILNLLRRLSENSTSYILLNFFGSGLMIVYSVLIVSYPFLILNIVWTGFAGYKLVTR